MGKYSLDAFERYPLVKLRPRAVAMPPGSYRLTELSWRALEPEPNRFVSPPPLPRGDAPALLRVVPEPPAFWSGDIQAAGSFIRRIGAAFAGGAQMDGVVAERGAFSGAALRELALAYIQGFDKTVLLAAPGSEMFDALAEAGAQPGLWLELSQGILPLRRAIAEHGLERTWRVRPVYGHLGTKPDTAQSEAAARWHVSGLDTPAPLGAWLTLRRAMFPRDLTAGGAMPLRLWWQNLGTAPLYAPSRVRLSLRNSGDWIPIVLDGKLDACPPGDTMLNTTARLPQLPDGEYSLWCGLETDRGLLALGIDAPRLDGLYEIGTLRLDHTPRPYLETLWDEQYADGYYPLEDPAQPE